MANKVIKGSVGLRDARGQVGKCVLYAQWGEAGGTFAAAKGLVDNSLSALVALSNAVPISWGGVATPSGATQVLNPAAWGDNQEFPNVEDKAVLVFTNAGFGFFRVSIPAPIGTGADDIFLPDGETVNALAANVAAFITAMIAVGANAEAMSSKDGALILSYVGGFRSRRRFQRKMTIWQFAPDLAEPEE